MGKVEYVAESQQRMMRDHVCTRDDELIRFPVLLPCIDDISLRTSWDVIFSVSVQPSLRSSQIPAMYQTLPRPFTPLHLSFGVRIGVTLGGTFPTLTFLPVASLAQC